MANSYTLDVVTPERVMLRESVYETIAPGSEGELGILAHHAPLMTELLPGTVRVQHADGRTASTIVISGGFLEVSPQNAVTILADSAERADEIETSRAEADLEAARRMLAEAETGTSDQREALRAVAHQETRVRASRSR